MNISIIGFGEAGPVFAAALKTAGMSVKAFDRLQLDPKNVQAQMEKTNALGIGVAADLASAIQGADLVISTVTASEALNAARQSQPHLQPGTHWLDLNSVSPETKAHIQQCVAAGGAGFTEAVAMDTVPSKGAAVPLLLCGPESIDWSERLNDWGLNTKVVGAEYGKAATIKLLRSVIIKGMESLFAESMESAGKAGVAHEVIHSLQATYPGLDWAELAGYQLSRSVLHAKRRAAEMREAAQLVESLGVESSMSRATVDKQQEMADRNVASNFSGNTINDFIQSVLNQS